MIRVEQTELADYNVDPPVRGNCLAACVASIFEAPIELLKGVYGSQDLWNWLGHYVPGIGMIARSYEERPVPLGSKAPEGFTGVPGLSPWIAVAQSPRSSHMHCVVMVGREMVWDPHPMRRMGVGGQTGDYAFTLNRPEMAYQMMKS